MHISDIFFTKRCIGCGQPMDIAGSENICDVCRPDFVPVSGRLFYVRGLEFMKAYYLYEGRVKSGLRRFKFLNDGYTGRVYAEKIAGMIKREPLFPTDYIMVSVPGKVKKTDREYVQADYLAGQIAKLLKKEYISGAVIKRSGTKSQTKCRTAAERRENVKGSLRFNSRFREDIAGKNIVVVDDISTTGATLSEMADILHTAGAKKIYGVCAAKTPKPCDRREKSIIVNPEDKKTIEIIKPQSR